jgi:hypothetical protein
MMEVSFNGSEFKINESIKEIATWPIRKKMVDEVK